MTPGSPRPSGFSGPADGVIETGPPQESDHEVNQPVEVVAPPLPLAERSPCDVLRLVVATVVLLAALLIQWLFERPVVNTTSDLFRGLDTVPAAAVDAALFVTWMLGLVMLVGGLVAAL